ncbi:MAG: hypothetical protein PHZ13_01400 [bacterium]|jgi:hypothetical protein|nr:hypothetical protein [bacterium]MDD3624122.1 hypothetical protein [Proteiniphilum sp.]MDD3969184.1 hypothetical protein [Proteiniphilum sp.]MDD4458180.1 hypothetical protein [Proteiniphilum sp.]
MIVRYFSLQVAGCLANTFWGQRTIRFYDPDGHLIEASEAMPLFLQRIYNEEGENLEATSKRTFVPVESLKQILGI